MCILNTEGCNVLETLPEGEYMRCLDLLRDIILGSYSKRRAREVA